MCYLNQRGLQDPTLIKELEIGYAPGGCLRRHLTAKGHSLDFLRESGLLNMQGSDALYQRIVFPSLVEAAQPTSASFANKPHQVRTVRSRW